MALSTKIELRKDFLDKRNALDAAVRARHSSLIRQRVFAHPAWKMSETILCYVSFGTEVDTHPLIQEALRFKKRLVVPLVEIDGKETAISELRRLPDLLPGPRGVEVPRLEAQKRIDPGEVDLALVPGIVFDRQGERIGFGGGYFDRLLPQMSKARRMGIAFSMQVSNQLLPHEPHDAAMHWIVTENEMIPIGTPS